MRRCHLSHRLRTRQRLFSLPDRRGHRRVSSTPMPNSKPSATRSEMPSSSRQTTSWWWRSLRSQCSLLHWAFHRSYPRWMSPNPANSWRKRWPMQRGPSTPRSCLPRHQWSPLSPQPRLSSTPLAAVRSSRSARLRLPELRCRHNSSLLRSRCFPRPISLRPMA